MLDGKIGNEKVGLAWNTNYWLEMIDMELLGCTWDILAAACSLTFILCAIAMFVENPTSPGDVMSAKFAASTPVKRKLMFLCVFVVVSEENVVKNKRIISYTPSYFNNWFSCDHAVLLLDHRSSLVESYTLVRVRMA